MSENLWCGKIVSTEEFKNSFDKYVRDPKFWSQPPLSHYVLFDVVEKIRLELLQKDRFYMTLIADLKSRVDITEDEVSTIMDGLIDFLSVDQLRLKLKRELGSEHPFELKRQSSRAQHFEACLPQAHAPSNFTPTSPIE